VPDVQATYNNLLTYNLLNLLTYLLTFTALCDAPRGKSQCGAVSGSEATAQVCWWMYMYVSTVGRMLRHGRDRSD